MNVAERSSASSYLVSMNSDYLVNNLLTELRRCDKLIISCKILLHMGRTYSIEHIVLCLFFSTALPVKQPTMPKEKEERKGGCIVLHHIVLYISDTKKTVIRGNRNCIFHAVNSSIISHKLYRYYKLTNHVTGRIVILIISSQITCAFPLQAKPVTHVRRQ